MSFLHVEYTACNSAVPYGSYFIARFSTAPFSVLQSPIPPPPTLSHVEVPPRCSQSACRYTPGVGAVLHGCVRATALTWRRPAHVYPIRGMRRRGNLSERWRASGAGRPAWWSVRGLGLIPLSFFQPLLSCAGPPHRSKPFLSA